MKKLFLLAASVAMFVGCSVPTKLITSSTYTKVNAVDPIVAVFADLDVAKEKITYLFIPSKSARNGGADNVIDSAVSEALANNGGADVLVGLEKQVKYNSKGEVESVVVSGYPAKYVNFRSPGDEYLREVSEGAAKLTAKAQEASSLGKFKLGK